VDAALSNRIAATRALVGRIQQQHEYEQTTISRLHSKLKQLEEDKAQLVKAVGLIDRCIQVISANGIGRIESIVTAGLRTVFGEDSGLSFVIEKKDKVRGTDYRLLVRQGETVGSPMESFGGGVQNVVAFLLRVILIKRFKLARMLALDENFSNVGNEDEYPYLEKTSEMLRTLCDKYGYRILAITHQPILANAADNIYRVLPSGRGVKTPTLTKISKEQLEQMKAGGAFEASR
jgi:DNA repair exonuclease SbcCD ATPase subunit